MPPMWGDSTSRSRRAGGSCKRGLSAVTGSGLRVSSPAPRRCPLSMALRRASWSTISPRAVLMRMLPGFMRLRARSPMIPAVSGATARWTETMSHSLSSRSKGRYSKPDSGLGVRFQ